MLGSNPVVKVVWRSGGPAVPPAEMGTPRADQLLGTPLDVLVELAGRVAYDSLGAEKSRGSEGYHKHIREVRHNSVLQHAHLIFSFDTFAQGLTPDLVLGALLGRPGVKLTDYHDGKVRFVCNLRAAAEWHERDPVYAPAQACSEALGALVQNYFQRWAPLATGPVEPFDDREAALLPNFGVVDAKGEEETYVSLFFSNVSRAFSHEWVRHGFDSGISQRSGRYCPDDLTPWVMHPLLRDGAGKTPEEAGAFEYLRNNVFPAVMIQCRSAYKTLFVGLKRLLDSSGMAPFDATKQARGAARGLLGNALGTELIYTAGLAQWKRIFLQRCHPAADAEIREVAGLARESLRGLYPGVSFDYDKPAVSTQPQHHQKENP